MASAEVEIHVSPTGDDGDEGDDSNPLVTLAAARDRARRHLLDGKGVRVVLQEGYHLLRETLVLGPEDGGGAETPIVWRGGKKVLVGSGVPISGWQPLKEDPPNLAAAARGKLWVADLPAGTARITTLYQDLQRLSRARSRNFNPTQEPDKSPPELNRYPHAPDVRPDVVYLPPEMIGAWDHLDDVELFVRPKYGWICNFLTFSELDRSSGRAVTTVPATYPMTCEITHLEGSEDRPCWLENYLEVLDQPGEWVYDSATRRLYLWPADGEPGDDIRYPALSELVRIEGDEASGSFSRHLNLEEITFVHGARETLAASDSGIQHDWEMWDKGNALVRLRGAERIVVHGCRFTASSGGGIRLDRHAKHNRVDGNLFEHLGGTGVLLCGYGPGTLDVNKQNRIINNTIHHCGEILWHSLGITVWQSGENEIAHNLIHHMPYTGLAVIGVRPPFFAMPDYRENSRTIRYDETGTFGEIPKEVPWDDVFPFLHSRHNRVSHNELHHMCLSMEDGNGIYVSGCGTGNEICFNYIHHVISRDHHGALRTDDWTRGSRWHHNVVRHSTYAGFVLKHDNTVEDNLFIDFQAPLIGMLVVRRDPCDRSSVHRNVFLNSADENLTFVKPEKAEGLRDVDHNVYWATGNEDWAREALKEMRDRGFEANGAVVEVRLVDADRLDFRIEPNEQLEALGIYGVDLSDVGPT
jgi:hypothetical protein